MVIIVSWSGDEHAEAVANALRRAQCPFKLLDLAQFPRELMLTMRYHRDNGDAFVMTSGELTVDFAETKSVWWRRPRSFQLHSEVSAGRNQNFALNECAEAAAGLWQVVDAFWINPPAADQVAARKTYQLKVAKQVGLRVPDTLVTSNPGDAAGFIHEHTDRSVICKAFSATEHDWRETRIVGSQELEVLDNVRFAPVIFQEYIPAHADLRVTVVGQEVFPAAIYSQDTAYPVDFRIDMNRARTEAVELPDSVASQLQGLMARLGLVYGAIDMRLTPDGEYVFLEVNPAGQWLFIEQRTGQPITRALAETLERGSC